MNNVNQKLHYYQVELIKKLSLNPLIKFNDLIIEGLASEHMNYHLKKLLELGFVIKQNTKYTLTDIGKDFSNLLSEETEFIEKQPKTSIVIHAKRKNKKGKVEHLLAKRLRQPYFGKVGHLTGKVRFGETLEEAASRELFEETGLTAKKFKLKMIYHKMRKRNEEWVQDVIFYVFLITEISGKLIKKTSYQENFWVTKEDLAKRKDFDLYDDFYMEDEFDSNSLKFVESRGKASGY